MLRSRYTNFGFEIGSSRTRFPFAAKMALVSAGAIGGSPGSPTPPGGASLSTMWTFDLDGRVVDARHLEQVEVGLGDPARGERKELLDGVRVADKRDHLAIG